MQSNFFCHLGWACLFVKKYIFFSIVKSRGHEWLLRPISVGRSPSHVAHQLPGDAGSFSSFETLCPRPERTSRTSADSQRKIHTEVMEQIWKKFGRAQVDLFASRKTSQLSLLVLLDSSSSIGAGCHGTDMAEASSVRLPPRLLCLREFWRKTLHGRFPPSGISSLSGGGSFFHPMWSCGNCGCGP